MLRTPFIPAYSSGVIPDSFAAWSSSGVSVLASVVILVAPLLVDWVLHAAQIEVRQVPARGLQSLSGLGLSGPRLLHRSPEPGALSSDTRPVVPGPFEVALGRGLVNELVQGRLQFGAPRDEQRREPRQVRR